MMRALDWLFWTNLALLVVHELDAVRRREWRMLPLLNRLGDQTAYRAFVLLHVPIVVVFLWCLGHPYATVRLWFQTFVDAFLVVHVGLHHVFRTHEANEFATTLSRRIIQAMAMLGALHLAALWGLASH
ncbi:MAG: DUF6713 family protein [Planctomycetota bacterium]|jgi:hypothetical protein